MRLVSFAQPEKITQNSILLLDLNGVIFDSKAFLKKLKKYREDDLVKAVVVRINSPGGVVGPSQEIYEELKRTKEEFGKPVVAYAESLAASGAYYAALGCDHIVAQQGALLGSIGVIMEFVNLEDLYKWAKVERFSIKTGVYKDIGAEYRKMTQPEKAYLQDLLQEVLTQFKTAIVERRKMSIEQVDEVADGRIFTGTGAQKLKLVDSNGSLEDAIKVAAKLANITDKPNVFEAPKEKPMLLDYLSGMSEEEGHSKIIDQLSSHLGLNLSGQLLYLYPAGLGTTFR